MEHRLSVYEITATSSHQLFSKMVRSRLEDKVCPLYILSEDEIWDLFLQFIYSLSEKVNKPESAQDFYQASVHSFGSLIENYCHESADLYRDHIEEKSPMFYKCVEKKM